MTDVNVTLGGVVFEDLEVPDRIPFGGHQAAKVHKLIGGARQVDAMGRDDKPLQWSGRFFGSDALTRALAIDAMRQAGRPVSLTWDALSYTVLITSFEPDYEYSSNLPYSIICEIIADNAIPVGLGAGPSLDDAVASDLGSASTISGLINDPGINTGMASLQSAMASVQSFTSATVAQISAVLVPLVALRTSVSTMAASLDATILSVSSGSVGGVIVGGQNVASTLLAQVAAVQQLPLVDDLGSVLGRMQSNLTSAQTAGASVVQVGGNLYDLAAQAYGTEDSWPAIAEANGLLDPVLSGINSLVIPPSGGAGDGILSP